MSWINKITNNFVSKQERKGTNKAVRSTPFNPYSARCSMDPKEILEVVRPWVAGEKFVSITLPGQSEVYITHFSPQGHDSNMLLQHLGLLVEPFYPLAGNMIIRSTRRAIMNISTEKRQFRAEVLYCGVVIGRHGHRVLLLGFPEQLHVWSQMRDSARVVLGKRTLLSAQMTWLMGDTFEVPTREMGMGGLSFWKPTQKTEVGRGTKIRCTLSMPRLADSIIITGQVVRIQAAQGKPFVRIRFDEFGRILEQQIKSMISILRQENCKRRDMVLQN